jgi:hypothetical protein
VDINQRYQAILIVNFQPERLAYTSPGGVALG